MDSLLRDLRYAYRTLLKSPGFTLVTVLTLALGVGATTAVFSVVNGVLLRPLPYPEPDEIVQVWQVSDEGGRGSFSDPNFRDVRERSRSFEVFAQYADWPTSVTGGSEAVRVTTTRVSDGFLEVFGVMPMLGRGFVPEEQQPGGSPAVLVSHEYWRTQLGGSPDIAGRTLTFDNRTHAVVGVMPPGFDFPGGTDLWTPRELEEPSPYRTGHNWRVVGRLAEGVTLEQAQRELTTIARSLKEQYGDDTWMSDAAAIPLHEQTVGRVRPVLLVLLGAAGFLLLISCANAANLLLARAASRQREVAVRLALGANRGRLVQQLVVEALVLSLAGGVFGALLAKWGVDMLIAVEPGNLPRVEEIGVDATALAFVLAVSVLAAVGLGLVTALRLTRADAQESLAHNQRSQTAAGSGSGTRGALVASQVALTLVLLVGAGLLGRSLLSLLAVDPGYRTEDAVVMNLSLPYPETPEAEVRLARFHDELADRLRSIPGVEHVGGVNTFPLSGGGANGTFLILNGGEDFTDFEVLTELFEDESRTGEAYYRIASEDYFAAMGIPLLRGRLFDERRDGPDAPHVAVISQSLAEARWPGEDPIGKLIEFGNMDGDLRPFTIVGIVADTRELGLDTEPLPTFYGYSRQRVPRTSEFSVVLSAVSEPGPVISTAGRILRELDPEVPPRFRTIEEVFATSLAQRRFSLILLGVFGAAALLLAVLGIYGVVSYAVAQRTQEIGIRMALGARAGDVLGLIVRHGLTLTLIGVALGLAVAFAATRLMASMLYGVGTTDAVTFVLVPLVLGATAALASWLPARRATRVDPMVALRSE